MTPSTLNPQPSTLPINIGIIGCGTVGGGVVKLLTEQAAAYAQRLGRPVAIRKILVRNTSTKRDLPVDASVYTDNPDELFIDESISIILEVAGGIEPVKTYVRRAIESGRHVVTANKALLAAHGGELFALARKHKVAIAFEASCGGTIPMLHAIKFGLSANRIDAIYGILNGTCNYILSQMAERGRTYADALAAAQAKGYAEADPTLDVNGADTAQKLAIVASLAFGAAVEESDVRFTGIDTVQLDDIKYGQELGYTMKLLAIAENSGEAGLLLRVQPCFIHDHEPLAQVRDAFNAISVFGHASGHVMLYGAGAGQMPTASAVVSDLINVAGDWYPQAFGNLRIWPDQHAPLAPSDADASTRYYLRIAAKDSPGAMSQITKVLGDHGISISAIVQHESEDTDFVPLIITTHESSESAITTACDHLANLPVVRDTPVRIRIVDPPSDA